MHSFKVFAAALLTIVSSSAAAASLTLVYAGDGELASDGAVLVSPGEEIEMHVVADFSGPGEATIGGGYDITFDGELLEFLSWLQPACPSGPCQIRPPDVLDGLLFSASFADFNGFTGPLVVAEVAFIYIGTGNAGDTSLGMQNTTGIGGPFVSAIDYQTILEVDFHGITLRAVPLPGAAVLLMSAFGALACVMRPRSG